MSNTVKNVTLGQIDVGDGRLVAAGRRAEDVDIASPAVAMHLRSGALIDVSSPAEPTAKERVAHIATADLPVLEQIEDGERARDRPRTTVLEAIASRRSHLNAQENLS